MLIDTTPIISVDDHVVEPPHTWTDRLPAKWKDAGPRLVTDDDGSEQWLYEGRVYVESITSAIVGRDYSEWQGRVPMRFSDILPGCYDPAQRRRDMDRDGVAVQLLFPNWPGHAGTRFLEGDDKALALACVQAWNDFVIDEWYDVTPRRFIPICIVPMWDPQASAREVERMAARGARGVTFPENPVPRGLPSFHTDHWDPLFAAVEATGLVVCLHFGSSGVVTQTAPEAPWAVTASLLANNAQACLADIVFSGLLTKFPELRIALSEGGVGWIPYMLERMDRQWEHYRFSDGIEASPMPSELFRRHFWGCTILERFGLEVRHEVGVDRIMLESDYPHGDTSWPHTRKVAADLLANVPDDEAELIAWRTASELFRFPLPDG